MKDFLAKLTSRKFLLTVAIVAQSLAEKRYDLATAAVVAYLGVEGAADYKRAQQA